MGQFRVTQPDPAVAGEGDAELDEDGVARDLSGYLMPGPVVAAGDGGAVVVVAGPAGQIGDNPQAEPGLRFAAVGIGPEQA